MLRVGKRGRDIAVYFSPHFESEFALPADGASVVMRCDESELVIGRNMVKVKKYDFINRNLSLSAEIVLFVCKNCLPNSA